jgi:uncharacterized membrane protein YgdD (TMEM256/DUF423 family)
VGTRQISEQAWFALGAFLAFVAVALGAFGAHALKQRLSADSLAVFETGVRYQMYHSLALLAVAYAAERWSGGLAAAAGILFVVGIVLFSGSLYLLGFTGVRALGAVTPFGGLAFLAGWTCLIVAALRA